MKKIPTLFKREFAGGRVVGITSEITLGCGDAFLDGIATVKWDGSACAIIDGEFYKRYDCKPGETAPPNGIPCSPRDEVTGHWPFWVPVDTSNPADKWFSKLDWMGKEDWTYEAVGPHFNGNPHHLERDKIIAHGIDTAHVNRLFEDIRNYLEVTPIEGIVFWLGENLYAKSSAVILVTNGHCSRLG